MSGTLGKVHHDVCFHSHKHSCNHLETLVHTPLTTNHTLQTNFSQFIVYINSENGRLLPFLHPDYYIMLELAIDWILSFLAVSMPLSGWVLLKDFVTFAFWMKWMWVQHDDCIISQDLDGLLEKHWVLV